MWSFQQYLAKSGPHNAMQEGDLYHTCSGHPNRHSTTSVAEVGIYQRLKTVRDSVRTQIRRSSTAPLNRAYR